MDDARWGNLAFGVYDFFAYILPGLAFVAPPFLVSGRVGGRVLHAVRENALANLVDLSASGPGAVIALLFGAVFVYIVGLLIHLTARWFEEKVLERKVAGQPSTRLLAHPRGSLRNPLPANIRATARRQFNLPDDAPDAQLWALAYRYIAQRGSMARTLQFLFLHNLTRGLTLVSGVWTLIFLAISLAGREGRVVPVTLGLVALTIAVGCNHLRKIYNSAVAEEVYLSYYVLTTTGRPPTDD